MRASQSLKCPPYQDDGTVMSDWRVDPALETPPSRQIVDAVLDAVAAGRLKDRQSGEPVHWRPMPMVMPLGEPLREVLHSVDYEIRAIRAQKTLEFELALSPA